MVAAGGPVGIRPGTTQTNELIEQSSDYEDAVSFGLLYYVRTVVQAIAVPSPDPARIYVGERRGPHGRVFVWVQNTDGNRYPLQHADQPYREADGTGFEWGYGGHGPSSLTRCILADAFDGDLVLADEVDHTEDGFFEKFILHYPRDEDLRISSSPRRTLATGFFDPSSRAVRNDPIGSDWPWLPK